MKRRDAWLKTAARAHAALTQHRLQDTQQARAAASAAEQRATTAAREVHALANDWSRRRKQGDVDTLVDLAYADFHRHLVSRTNDCDDLSNQAQTVLATATSSLRIASNLTRVLDEVLALRQKEHVAADMKKELRRLGECWLLAKGQQRGDDE